MRSKLAVTLTAAVVLAATLTGCAHDNNRDLKNVHNTDPDYVVNILNMDRQPNVALLCFKGGGDADHDPAVQRVDVGTEAGRVLRHPEKVRGRYP